MGYNMDRIKLYWEFHKSMLPVNWVSSIVASFIFSFHNPLLLMPIMSITWGPLAGILLKEFSGNEYYFYYNRGIQKSKLFMISYLLDILVCLIWLAGYYYVKSA
jgi:hypothetical protein